MTFTYRGSGNFAVWSYTVGQVVVDPGTIILVVTADGPWTAAFTP
jgi:hypothetical protein